MIIYIILPFIEKKNLDTFISTENAASNHSLFSSSKKKLIYYLGLYIFKQLDYLTTSKINFKGSNLSIDYMAVFG